MAVTGGAQGIGRAIAFAFACKGYAVSIADPAEDAGAEAVEMMIRDGGQALHECVDIGKTADITRWMTRTVAEFAAPAVLVNNAGISVRKPFLELTADEFDQVLAVNLGGAFLASQAAARAMIAAAIDGAIINIASTRVLMSEPGTEAYSASKGGIVALTHAMAMSLGPRIRLNAVSPGWIETRDWQFSGRAKSPDHSPADRSQHPVGRVGTPDDIAKACLFLAKNAGFMTGQNLVIDGGMTIKMIYA
jgi:NAD(P)-dependent dehydrogenase (short-subunit alcohol dehydrogenase family)